MPYISVALRQLVYERADGCCEYCQSCELITGGPMNVEHILPLSKDGTSEEKNLALSCIRCNSHKADRTTGFDVVTSVSAPLFNPRIHIWSHHFRWSALGTHIIGLTPIGRATITILNMNDATIVRSRAIWAKNGWHPPNIEM